MGPLLKIPKRGGAPSPLARGPKEPAGLAVDGARVYFIEQVDATLRSMAASAPFPRRGATP